MSDNSSEGEPTRAQRRADAKAEKARQKALRPWYRKKRFILPAALVGLLVMAGIAGGGSDTNKTNAVAGGSGADTSEGDVAADGSGGDTTADGGQGEEQEERAGIGEPAADGRFTFTVEGLDCGKQRVGNNEFTREEAQGRFCLLTVTVENTGEQPGSLFADNQYLIDGQNARHSASFQATFAAAPQGQVLFEEINPGNQVQGAIVFDVPGDRRPVRAELHDSAFSGGVLVDVRG